MTENTKKNRGKNLRIWLVVLVAVVALFAMRFRQLGRDEAVAGIRSVQETQGIPVETVAAELGDLDRWTTLAGTVEGVVQYPVVSNNALRVVGIPVREGDTVSAGDVVLRLADEAPSPMFHSVEKSRATYRNTLADTRRMRNLFAEGAISEQELDAAETSLKVAAQDLADAEGSTALVAGEGGVVTSILVVEGETVEVGEPLIRIARTDEVKVCFDAGSRQALALAVGQKAVWSEDGIGEIEGEISQLDLMADPQTHLLEGEALFPNPDGRLLPGLLVSVRVRTVHLPDILTVPADCLVDDGEGTGVWVVADGGDGPRASLRPVQTGVANVDRAQIVAGLEAGRRVVLHGQTLLSEGALIKDVGAGEEN